MKNNPLKWAFMLLISSVMLTACTDSDGDGEGDHSNPLHPKSATTKAFEAQFPTAQNVSWTKKKGYDVASFTLGAVRATPVATNTAWYPEGGTKCTYSKIEITWQELQTAAPAVAKAWEASPYKAQGYVLDDIKAKNYADATPTYKLEIELNDLERELVYDQQGTLITDTLDIDDKDDDQEDDPCPQTLIDFISANLPNAVIIDTDDESDDNKGYAFEVTVRVGKEEMDLYFDKHYNFLYIEVEVDDDDYKTALPEAIYKKFLELAPDEDSWDDLTIRRDLKGDVLAYVLETEDQKSDKEVIIILDAQGNVIK